jgi:diazepam-binding inhibitor (GABA receptor modulator, acyl-CoA-binding protein)
MMSKVEEAAERLKSLTERPSNDEFLNLYGLYKQATFGDNRTSKPGMFDMKGQFKWKAWKDKSGMSQDDAANAYVALVEELLGKYKHS